MEKIYIAKNQAAVFFTTDGQEIEVSLEMITPELAQVYRGRVQNNRAIKAKTVDAYARDMADGKWRVNGEPLIFFKGGAQADGEHRELACIKAGVPFETLVVRGIDGEAMKTINSGVKRNTGDKLKIEFGEEIADSITTASVIKSILDLRDGGTMITSNTRLYSETEILEEFGSNKNKYNDIVRFAATMYSKNRSITKSEIATMAYWLIYDLHHSEEKVKSFFRQFADVDAACVTVRTLRQRLNAIKDKDGETRVDLGGGKSIAVIRRILITKAWNAYAEGKDLSVINYVYDRDKVLKLI